MPGDMTGKCFFTHQKQEPFMLGLKLGNRRKQWANIKMSFVFVQL